MVKLTRIYTRGGDKGETSLSDGTRVKKHALRIEAIGAVDEANAAIGMARLQTGSHAQAGPDTMLGRIQNDLFDLGADISTPEGGGGAKGPLRILASQVERLEHEVDAMNTELQPLDSFVLPGGTSLAAALHVARTVVRRAERLTVALHAKHPQTTNPETVKYLNRLSDLLFVLSRVANDGGAADVKWVPGKTRGGRAS